MNKLSWLIYWADAAPHISEFICIIGFMIFIISLFLVFVGLIGCGGDEARGEKYAVEIAPRFRKLWPLTLVAFLMWGGSFLVPSKDTFYLIAASEAGERAMQTPEFVKVRQVLNHWLTCSMQE